MRYMSCTKCTYSFKVETRVESTRPDMNTILQLEFAEHLETKIKGTLMLKAFHLTHVSLYWLSGRKFLIIPTDYLPHNYFILLQNQKRPTRPLSEDETASKRPRNVQRRPFLKFCADGSNSGVLWTT